MAAQVYKLWSSYWEKKQCFVTYKLIELANEGINL